MQFVTSSPWLPSPEQEFDWHRLGMLREDEDGPALPVGGRGVCTCPHGWG